MNAVLVVVGLALASLGYTGERIQPRLNRGTAVGVVLFVIGEILLFGVSEWWGLIGLTVVPLLVEAVLAVTRRR